MRILALALALIPFLSLSASADPQKASIANGLVSFSIPDGWAREKNPDYEVEIIPEGAQPSLIISCISLVAPLPWTPSTTQEALNAGISKKTIADYGKGLKNGRVLRFSNDAVIDGVRVTDLALDDGESMIVHSRSFLIAHANAATAVALSCSSASGPIAAMRWNDAAKQASVRAADEKKIDEIFRTLRVHRK